MTGTTTPEITEALRDLCAWLPALRVAAKINGVEDRLDRWADALTAAATKLDWAHTHRDAIACAWSCSKVGACRP